MANPYPANIQDSAGNVRIAGAVAFTDPDNQPGDAGPTFYTGAQPIDATGTVFALQEDTPSTSGTFTLTFRGETTALIAFDAGSQDIADALAVLDSIAFEIAVPEGYEGLFLNEDQIRLVFTGTLLGPTEDPTVTNDTTDNGVTLADISTGQDGDPPAPAQYDIYERLGVPPLLYVFDGSQWNAVGVADDGITTDKIADDAVTNAKLAGGAVTAAKIATGAVEGLKIADGAVGPNQIEAGAVKRAAMGKPMNNLPHGSTVNQLIDELIVANVMEPP